MKTKDNTSKQEPTFKKFYNKSILTRIVIGLLLMFFIVTLINQLVIFFTSANRTEVALLYETTATVPFKGIFVRDERVINIAHSGIIAYTHKDGTKLAKNSAVAQSYNSKRDILLQSKIAQIEGQIKILKEAEDLKNTDNSQIEALSNQITNNHSAFMEQICKGDFENVNIFKNNFLSLQSKKEIVRGTYYSFNDKVSELRGDIDRLSAQISRMPHNVVVSDSGYFVSNVDGYEGKINTKNIKSFTIEQLEEIIKNPKLPVADDVIGKMIDDYKWQLVGIFETKEIHSVYNGADARLRLGLSSKVINVIIKDVRQLDGGKSIIIFECDQLTDEFLQSRTAQFNLLMNNYSGIRIPRTAVRFNDQGESGVFIKIGVELNFAKIKVLLNEEEYLIVENTTETPGYLSLYDLIVVGGFDLYEGKIVNE